ncbi:MAG: MFS transporter [Gammaproteobacteria bacterium]|nr:MFS transporter [Gammaproteobacteria bacterium]
MVLSESRRLRLAVFTSFYVAQGIPIGLLTIAIPAWLATEGMSIGEIAGYQAIVSIPWALKLVTGPFMDRFTFLPMGFRRPWVIGAQGGLTLAMLSLTVIDDPMQSLTLLMTLGFIVNAFAATQDVAVDGMAIDILPADERGRANALMGFGQVAGFSAYGALSGTLLQFAGMPITALVCSLSVGLIFVLATVIRERPGERLVPWRAGEAAPRDTTPEPSFRVIFKDLFRVLFLPMSLILTLVELANRIHDGIAVAVVPTFAIQELGFTTAQYTQFSGAIGFVAAFIGALAGPYIDRFGARRFLMFGLIGSAAAHFLVAFTPSLWPNVYYIVSVAFVDRVLSQFIFVAIIAMYMNLCWAKVAATQFAIYMSLANLSRSIGSALFALVANRMTFQSDFVLMGACLILAAAALVMFKQQPHDERLAKIQAAAA